MDQSPQTTERRHQSACLLFVPAVKADYYQSALSFSSHLAGIVLDLEDSVSPMAKAQARAIMRRQLPDLWEKVPQKCWIRINNRESSDFEKDLALVKVLASDGIFPSVMYPKYGAVSDLLDIRAALPKASQRIFVNIESFAAIENVAALLTRDLQISAAAVGAEDLSAWLGIDRPYNFYSNPLFAYAAARVASACHAVGIEFWGNIWPFVADENIRSQWIGEIQDDIRLGAEGKAVFHPKQIEDVNRAFETAHFQAESLIDKLNQLLSAARTDGSLVALYHSKMIDGPEITRARRLLQRYPHLELSALARMFAHESEKS